MLPTPETVHKIVLPQIAIERQSSPQLADNSYRPEPPRYKLCNDRSNTYLKLPLKTVAPIFRPCAMDFLYRTQVPIVLPHAIPERFTNGSQYDLRYVSFYIPFTNSRQYSIAISWKADEHYQTEGIWFSGEKLTPRSTSLNADYEKRVQYIRSTPFFLAKQESPSPKVKLSHGIDGYYIPYICGASCHGAYSIVVWDSQGYRYNVAIKMGKRAEVTALANAAIDNQK
jgi:hypothetical protein